ncbi:endolytic transglycosylase MltG [Bacillus sp. CGMCC 1.16541]|uniref:endolytic transglycosylase MltG n=1 Tax=Bacillus sp. CGMCC 1.16541 TaxID=2185143 RepID=UPI000D73C8C0|nr:endolytic transglycosylase MltG [Bacillus sp. CGMCC 1.16541]
MTPNSMRSFAFGLFVAATAMSAVYFLSPSSEATTTKEATEPEGKTLSEEEMKVQLEDKGFVIQTKDEWNKQLAEAKAETPAKDEQKPEEEKEVVYRTLINVTNGMTAVDVGRVLQQAKIVDSGFKFYKYVESRGVQNNLRPGTYEVESGMTTDEIIAVIFKK